MAVELGPGPVGPWSAEPVFKETGPEPSPGGVRPPSPSQGRKTHLLRKKKKERKPREANGH